MSERITPPRPESVLVIAAHPDDLEFSFAGTAAKWAQEGSKITYVLCTSGETGSHDLDMDPKRLAPIRQGEQRCAAEVLGVKEIKFLDYPDGTMENTLELRKDITKLIRYYRPDAVVSWDPTRRFFGNNYFQHPDHLVVGEATLAALMPACDSPFIFPELMSEGYEPFKVHHVYLFGTQEPNVWVDISTTIDKKIAAIECHKSQFSNWGKIAKQVQASAQSRGSIHNIPFAEVFRYSRL